MPQTNHAVRSQGSEFVIISNYTVSVYMICEAGLVPTIPPKNKYGKRQPDPSCVKVILDDFVTPEDVEGKHIVCVFLPDMEICAAARSITIYRNKEARRFAVYEIGLPYETVGEPNLHRGLEDPRSEPTSVGAFDQEHKSTYNPDWDRFLDGPAQKCGCPSCDGSGCISCAPLSR